MASPRLVRVSVAAELLGVCDETVYRLARRGRIAYFRDPETGHWLFSAASIERYLAANTVEARPLVDLTPAPRPARRRSANPLAAPTPVEDAPWRGSVWPERAKNGDGRPAGPSRRTSGGGGAAPSQRA